MYQIPALENIKAVETINEMSGTYIDITFTHGARVRLAMENDAILYFAPGVAEDEQATVGLLCDLNSGHHLGRADEVTLTMGPSCRGAEVCRVD